MLWLVVHTRLASPTNDKKARNAVHLVIHERRHGIYDIALAAVLHIDHGHLARCQVISCRKCGGISLVGGNDMMLADALGRCKITAKRL